MKKLILLLAVAGAVAAAVGFWRRRDASDLWDSTRDTVTSWGESAVTKAEEVADTAAQAADSATSAVGDAAEKAKDVVE